MGKNKSRWVHCAECGRNRLHYARGLCQQCWSCQYYAEHREERVEYQRQYHAEHHEEGVEYNRQWYEANSEHRREYDCQWAKGNPDKKQAQKRRRRAAKWGATIGLVDEAAIYERDKVCIYCGATENLTLDHLIPLSRGGAHTQDNLAVACRVHNSKKGTKTYEEFIKEQSDGDRAHTH